MLKIYEDLKPRPLTQEEILRQQRPMLVEVRAPRALPRDPPHTSLRHPPAAVLHRVLLHGCSR